MAARAHPVGPSDLDAALAALGSAAAFVAPTLQDTVNPTMLSAGYKHNVIPQTATARLDARFLPGHEPALLATLRELAGPYVDVEVMHGDISLDAPFDAPLVAAMERALVEATRALVAEDPGATVLPYCLSGGTDNKALSKLGITGYGFAPLRLPADLDFAAMFHGVDERVPLDSLAFGTRVMARFLADC